MCIVPIIRKPVGAVFVIAFWEALLSTYRVVPRKPTGTAQKKVKKMSKSKLDEVIERYSTMEDDSSYILSILRSYRSIVSTGCCNDCAIRLDCQYLPDLGETCRFNCPHYQNGNPGEDCGKDLESLIPL